jgi:hypothetical protein
MDFSIIRTLKYFLDQSQATSAVNRLIGIDPDEPARGRILVGTFVMMASTGQEQADARNG